VFILAAVLLMVLRRDPGEALAFSLTIAEALLFLILFGYVRLSALRNVRQRPLRPWFRQHFAFASRGFLSGVFTEINTRVDIIMLGIFMEEGLVGVYSYAALLAEGFGQLSIAVRRNVDPLLGRCFATGDKDGIEARFRRVRLVFQPGMLVVGAAAALVYPVLRQVLLPDPAFSASVGVFAILTVGVVLNAGHRPFGGILLQGGRPGAHTGFSAALVGANVVLNALLIPLYGVYGAAAATALVYALEAVGIALLARRLLGVRLW